MLGTMDGETGRERSCGELLDDKERVGEEIHILGRKAQDEGTSRTVVMTALDTYGR